MTDGDHFQNEFDRDRAAKFDHEFDKLSPLKDALHLLAQLCFREAGVRKNARALLVGVGTGAELFYLADAFPRWEFVALDTSQDMLTQCVKGCEQRGLLDRVTFFHGPVSLLGDAEPFDLATSFLVSHFLTTAKRREAFYADIAARLWPEGVLFSADLIADRRAPGFDDDMARWLEMLRYSGKTAPEVEQMRAAFDARLSLIGRDDFRHLLQRAGFPRARVVGQTFLIHGWFARRG